jgi:aminoglycoside phosphotransferase family enzyme/predicted kinase
MERGDDQSAVFAFLADPAAHGSSGPVVRIDTHGACVFLAGSDVYKVKRAVRFPFMDYSTLDARRRACEAEIAVNRDNAPELYLGVVPITRGDDGALRLGADGEIVEWAVHLRRFDENATLDRLAERDEFGLDLVPDLAAAVLAAHRRAPVRDAEAATAALKAQARDTLDDLARHPDLFPAAELAALRLALERLLSAATPLLLERGAHGQVRRCHGDLHLRNIALIDGRAVLFDAIEFDEAIATGDVLYDLAFLLMDLWERGLRPAANRLLNRYLWACDDEDLQIAGLALLPPFLALRAAIRAKVTAELARLSPDAREGARADARRYFDAARGFVAAQPAQLVAVGGLSGSGKSTLAARLAPSVGRPPGAVHLRSDIERKRLFGVGELDPLPAEAYEAEQSDRVYERLRTLAAIGLRAGQSVVVDAVHRREDERHAIAAVAAAGGVRFTGLWLDAPATTLRDRVAARRGDASDATPAVVDAQAAQDLGALTWDRLDAAAPIDRLEREALERCVSAGPDHIAR